MSIKDIKDIKVQELSDNVDGFSIDINSGNLNARIHLDDIVDINNQINNSKFSSNSLSFKYVTISVISILLILLIILAIYLYSKYFKNQNSIAAKFKFDYKNRYSYFMK